MLVALEAFPDLGLERGVLIRLTESFLVVEERRPWDTCCLEEILQAVVRLEDDNRLDFQARLWFLKSRNFFR